eukprot:6621977-Lingulodinium_polyedra.AAC.1
MGLANPSLQRCLGPNLQLLPPAPGCGQLVLPGLPTGGFLEPAASANAPTVNHRSRCPLLQRKTAT